VTTRFGGEPPGLPERYTAERLLGTGGSASVFLANDAKHKRRVAIKVLLPGAANTVSVERFFREIKLVARLVHPHIVPFIDSGLAAELPYFVMPYVEGESLRQRIERERRLPLTDALRLAREVADALDYAHAAGVVHRDIKPENILLNAGHAVVTDFGIAKAISAEADTQRSPSSVTTDVNEVIGTAAYMSPEQAVGGALDGRSDVYSLGIVLYEMLTGAPPFTGTTANVINRLKFTEDAAPVSRLRPETPAPIERALARALAREVADRFPTAREFADAIDSGRPSGEQRRPSPTGPPDAGPAIAVLPFANRSPNGQDEFISDGITDGIIDALMRLRRVRVVARTSVLGLKGKFEDVREIGRRLDVGTVLEGRVRRSGDTLHVAAELINATDGFQVWFGEFDRSMDGALRLYDEIAQSIVQMLSPSLLGTDVPSRTGTDAATYELYLRGRSFWNQSTPTGVAKAEECFRGVVARDPTFALGHAGLADAYASQFIYGLARPLDALPKAREHAERAIVLDPFAAEPHAALGRMRAILDWNWQAATASFGRAIALNPQYSTAYAWYADYVLMPLGRIDEALVQLARARVFDPLSAHINTSIGMAHFFAGRYDEAEMECRRVIDLAPAYLIAHYMLGRSLASRGRYSEALDVYRPLLPLSDGHPAIEAEIGSVHARAGNAAEATATLDALRAGSSRRYVSSCLPAQVQAALGNTDEAMRGFAQGFEERSSDLLWLGVAPELEGMRRDPRFRALLARIGLSADEPGGLS
jgi:serine/threonine-protein kinase